MTVVAKKSSTKKPNIALCAGFILLCLTLFSMHFTSDLYARYVSKDSAEDSARVIKFGELTLKETGDFVSGAANLVPGFDLKKDVEVSFSGTESSTYVFVQVSLSNHWWYSSEDKCYYAGTNLLSWTPHVGDKKWTKLGSNDVYYVELKPNQIMSDLDFIANDGLIKVSSAIYRNDLSSLQNMYIKLKAFVVQSNGFNNPSEAWASLVGLG